MKLLVVAAIIGMCSAGRLEHLERSYLPPHQGGQGSSHGSNFGSSGSFGNGVELARSFPGATSNQYLPPDHEPSSNGGFGGFGRSFGGHSQGGSFGAPSQQYSAPSQQYGAPSQQYNGPAPQHLAPRQQYSAPSQQYSAPSQQYSAPSQQYGTPNFGASSGFGGAQANAFGSGHGSSQIPQQSFDEQSGYQY